MFLLFLFHLGFCSGKPDGNYKDPAETTNGYITCSNGITYHMPCPEGLVWNDKAKICDYPHNVQKK